MIRKLFHGFSSIMIATFVISFSYVILCEAKVVTKEKAKVKLSTAQEPNLEIAPATDFENKIKEKTRRDKVDGGIEEIKEVTGTVSWIRDDVVAIEHYNKGGHSKVMLVPLSDVTDKRRLQSLQDLQVGDTIKVEFSEDYEEDADGKKRKFKRAAKMVDLIRSIDEK